MDLKYEPNEAQLSDYSRIGGLKFPACRSCVRGVYKCSYFQKFIITTTANRAIGEIIFNSRHNRTREPLNINLFFHGGNIVMIEKRQRFSECPNCGNIVNFLVFFYLGGYYLLSGPDVFELKYVKCEYPDPLYPIGSRMLPVSSIGNIIKIGPITNIIYTSIYRKFNNTIYYFENAIKPADDCTVFESEDGRIFRAFATDAISTSANIIFIDQNGRIVPHFSIEGDKSGQIYCSQTFEIKIKGDIYEETIKYTAVTGFKTKPARRVYEEDDAETASGQTAPN